jgi:hypothetical protein
MQSDDGDDLEALLIQREALRERGDPGLADCEARIRAAVARQGLTEDELADIEAQVLRERRHGPLAAVPGRAAFEGQYRIVGYARWIVLGIASLLALIIVAMGQPLVGIALVVIAVLAGFGPRRVRRIVVDNAGELHLGSRAAPALDWQRVRCMRLQRVEPWWADSLSKAAFARLDIVLEMVDGQQTRFGRGMFYQEAPVPGYTDFVFVRRYFEAECQRRGLRVEAIPNGFVAERRQPV